MYIAPKKNQAYMHIYEFTNEGRQATGCNRCTYCKSDKTVRSGMRNSEEENETHNRQN